MRIERGEMAPNVRHVAQSLRALALCGNFESERAPRTHRAPLDPLIRYWFAMKRSPSRGEGLGYAGFFSSGRWFSAESRAVGQVFSRSRRSATSHLPARPNSRPRSETT